MSVKKTSRGPEVGGSKKNGTLRVRRAIGVPSLSRGALCGSIFALVLRP